MSASDEKPVGKAPSESLVEKTEMVLPSDANNMGTVFGGRVMAWIDIAAAISAQRHCRGPVVTASMDDLHFLAPIKRGHVCVITAQVVYTGTTSMDVLVEVDGEDPINGRLARCCQAWLTFVHLDDYGKPVDVPPIRPDTELEKRRYAEAEKRRAERLDRKRTHPSI